MKKTACRIVGLIICASILLQTFAASLYATEVSDDYRDKSIVKYDELLNYTNTHQLMTNETGYLYKQWRDNINDKSKFTKGYLWCVQFLMGNTLDKNKYVDYLTKLIAMMEGGFSKSEAAQASYTEKVSGIKIVGDVVDTTVGKLIPKSWERVKKAYELLDDANKIIGTGADAINDVNQLRAIAVTSVVYEQKIAALSAIVNNTDNELLKDAANDVLKSCDLQFIYVIENYSNDMGKAFADTAYDIMDYTVFEDAYAIVKKAVATKSTEWIKKKCSKELAGTIIDAAGKIASGMSSFLMGFKLGVTIMKVWVGEESELFCEMTAMDDISNLLIKELNSIKQKATAETNPDEKYELIKKYAGVFRMLLYTHLRGEYCNVESRNERNDEGADEYYAGVCKLLNKYDEAIQYVFQPEDTFVVNELFELTDGFIVPVEQKTEVPKGYIGVYSFADLEKIKGPEPTTQLKKNEYNTAKYILMNDITCPVGYESINYFAGTLDGNGYTIYGVGVPVFNYIESATICNLGLDIAFVVDYEDMEANYGGIAKVDHTSQFTGTRSVIDNCNSKGYISITERGGYIGGLLGYGSDTKIRNCYNEADINVNDRQGSCVGGIASTSANVENCYNTGDVSCSTSGKMTFNAEWIDLAVGGIIAFDYDNRIENCYNEGNISACAEVSCGVDVGGIIGKASWEIIRNCINRGSVNSYQTDESPTTERDISNESLYGTGFHAGGIVGEAVGSSLSGSIMNIENCSNSGSVKSKRTAGGLVGYGGTSFWMINCCNDGGISAKDYAGGLMGHMGKVNVVNCYNMGTVSEATIKGALAGDVLEGEKAFENCYYLESELPPTSSCEAYSSVTELSKEELYKRSSFKDFDFAKIWKQKNDGTEAPMLRFRIQEDEDE